MDLPLTGEPLALDLINTKGGSPDGPVDHLATVEGLRRWLTAQAHRLPQPAADLTEADRAAVVELREAMTTVVDLARRGLEPPGWALRALSDADRLASPYRTLDWSEGRVVVGAEREGDYRSTLLSLLAGATIDLLAGPIGTVRDCEGPGCCMLFLPAHPRRRWCSPELCGNRVRVARYYRRHAGREPQA
ncbi:CGNR zinc finger domain-containing protein [Streptosporangium saharense]|uniref:Putative RNA-binding Zn ribbon-like protein n=1 Tax=Streptosporangium saharense TaxID=1706840 RepID=A0A7W7VRR0_9ACTN|nr:CGNR zinc finger domain-containing protein [Streptosporangium saharense]MBB4920337.1 putative RNA-binding Zn ribbon-like protein [Streptosporangium saharense]